MISVIALVLAKWTIAGAIILEFAGVTNVVHFLESGGGTLCHHQASRCFSGTDGPWAVCARCSGLYFGWLLPLVLGPVLKSRIYQSLFLRLATGLFLFAVVSALLERSGIFTTTNATRAILGIPLGFFPAFLIIFAVERLKEAIRTTPPHP